MDWNEWLLKTLRFEATGEGKMGIPYWTYSYELSKKWEQA